VRSEQRSVLSGGVACRIGADVDHCLAGRTSSRPRQRGDGLEEVGRPPSPEPFAGRPGGQGRTCPPEGKRGIGGTSHAFGRCAERLAGDRRPKRTGGGSEFGRTRLATCANSGRVTIGERYLRGNSANFRPTRHSGACDGGLRAALAGEVGGCVSKCRRWTRRFRATSVRPRRCGECAGAASSAAVSNRSVPHRFHRGGLLLG
jgi:hypothetical protein